MTRSISAAGVALLTTPCPDCGAGQGEWCRRRGHNINQQHDRRYQAWHQADRSVNGTDGQAIGDGRQAVTSWPA